MFLDYANKYTSVFIYSYSNRVSPKSNALEKDKTPPFEMLKRFANFLSQEGNLNVQHSENYVLPNGDAVVEEFFKRDLFTPAQYHALGITEDWVDSDNMELKIQTVKKSPQLKERIRKVLYETHRESDFLFIDDKLENLQLRDSETRSNAVFFFPKFFAQRGDARRTFSDLNGLIERTQESLAAYDKNGVFGASPQVYPTLNTFFN